MRMLRFGPILLLCTCFYLPAVAQHDHHQASPPPAELGAVHFENSCKPEVQATFTRAVALLHSFWYDESARQFRAAAEKDPECGIAWWGVGMTHWHPLWEPNGPNPDAMKAGAEALAKAQTAGARTERERIFIRALAKFYTDAEKTPHLDRVLAYEAAMRDLHSKFAGDHEATAFFALSLLGTAGSAPPDKTYKRQLEAGQQLEPLVRKEPNHPGIAHYIIHAYDYPTLAPRALEAARRYAKIAPDAPHALHMPSHIFTRLGLWQESIESNLASASAARKHNLYGDELHALDYLEFAYLQTGQDAKAEEVLRQVIPGKGQDAARFAGIYAAVAIPARFVTELRQWAKAAELPATGLPGGRYAWADATIYFARALGAARSGKPEQARTEVAKIAAAKQTLIEAKENYWTTQVEIQQRAAEAWQNFAEGKREDALVRMRSAVELENSTDKHPVTPGWVMPMHVLLGDMLIESKQPAEALDAYMGAMKTEPNRFAAIYGAARAADLKGDRKLAAEMYGKLAELGAKGNMDREELKQAKMYLASQVSRK